MTLCRVGATSEPLSIACYDIYDNRTHFASSPEVTVKLQANMDVLFHVKKFRTDLSNSKSILKLEVWFTYEGVALALKLL